MIDLTGAPWLVDTGWSATAGRVTLFAVYACGNIPNLYDWVAALAPHIETSLVGAGSIDAELQLRGGGLIENRPPPLPPTNSIYNVSSFLEVVLFCPIFYFLDLVAMFSFFGLPSTFNFLFVLVLLIPFI